jgi:hypothetical protein
MPLPGPLLTGPPPTTSRSCRGCPPTSPRRTSPTRPRPPAPPRPRPTQRPPPGEAGRFAHRGVQPSAPAGAAKAFVVRCSHNYLLSLSATGFALGSSPSLSLLSRHDAAASLRILTNRRETKTRRRQAGCSVAGRFRARATFGEPRPAADRATRGPSPCAMGGVLPCLAALGVPTLPTLPECPGGRPGGGCPDAPSPYREGAVPGGSVGTPPVPGHRQPPMASSPATVRLQRRS